MNVTTWWALVTTVILIGIGGWFFRRWIMTAEARQLQDFRRWTSRTALISAVLIIISAIPFATVLPTKDGFKDFAAAANAIGPLALTVSVTLATIFYSVGDWYEAAQRFRTLGILDARPDRRGRQADRAVHWQNVLSHTQNRAVITGVTLGGWFVAGWEDTRATLLEVLPRANVQVLLTHPQSPGFRLRADDPGEQNEAEYAERAPARAHRVYERIASIFEDQQFLPHLEAGRLSFYVYPMTPISVVWVDEMIYFTPYLPYFSDKACPEFSVSRGGQMGLTIANAIERVIQNANKIESAQTAADLAVLANEAD
jgi:hypothetical protein